MSSVVINREVIYVQVPTSVPDPSKIFEIRKGTIDLENTVLKNDEILAKSLYASIEPWLTPTYRESSKISEFPTAVIGDVVTSPILVQVLKSNNKEYAVGDILEGLLDWKEYTLITPATVPYIRKISYSKTNGVPLSYYLSVCGIPGFAAHTGLHKVCEPLVPGETLYISAAAGAVGQILGQYGKALGLRVVGSAGDDKKVEYLKKIGFDVAFNYKSGDLNDLLKEHCPKGIDIYFDTVGGRTLDTIFKHCNNNARIPLCGMISQYYRADNPEPVYNLIQVIAKSIRMQGFIISPHDVDCIEPFSKLIRERKMTFNEELSHGFDTLPEAFVKLLRRDNFGKLIIHIADIA